MGRQNKVIIEAEKSAALFSEYKQSIRNEETEWKWTNSL